MPNPSKRYGITSGSFGAINFDGSAPATGATSGFVASMSKPGTGQFSVSFTRNMPNTNYIVTVITDRPGTAHYISSKAVGSVQINLVDTVLGTAVDATDVNVLFFVP